MFDKLIAQLRELEDMKVSVGISTDKKGYLDKECPFPECKYHFKVNADDWKNIFNDDAVWCPLCGHSAPSDQWFTTEQVKHAKAEALGVVKGLIGNALQAGADSFNRRQPKGGFISMSMSMSVSGGSRRTYTIPAQAAEEMELEIQCEQCSSRFSVIGNGYFCPGCGLNSVTRTFADSLKKIKAKKDNLSSIREALEKAVGKDEAAITCRSLLESCVQDGVTAFQKYCEGLYSAYGIAPKNAFQRLEQGSGLWEAAIGKRYSDWLTPQEISDLNILFQKRHILSHNEGIVDEEYLKKSGDKSYKINQRIIIKGQDVEGLLAVLEKIGQELKASTSQASSQ